MIRSRFDEETVDFLLRLRWWDWDADRIFANMAALCSADIEKLKELEP